MSDSTIIVIAIMALMVIGAGVLVFLFIKNILAKRAYEREELPDISESDAEDEVLPDIDESSFSSIGAKLDSSEESVRDFYQDIYDERNPENSAPTKA